MLCLLIAYSNFSLSETNTRVLLWKINCFRLFCNDDAIFVFQNLLSQVFDCNSHRSRRRERVLLRETRKTWSFAICVCTGKLFFSFKFKLNFKLLSLRIVSCSCCVADYFFEKLTLGILEDLESTTCHQIIFSFSCVINMKSYFDVIKSDLNWFLYVILVTDWFKFSRYWLFKKTMIIW